VTPAMTAVGGTLLQQSASSRHRHYGNDYCHRLPLPRLLLSLQLVLLLLLLLALLSLLVLLVPSLLLLLLLVVVFVCSNNRLGSTTVRV